MARSRRLFYALWPDRATANRLQALQAGVQGRKAHIDDLHMTLVFLGNQPADRVGRLHELLHRLPPRDLTLRIDRLGHFPKARIAWAGMSEVPPALHELHQELLAQLTGAGVGLPDSGVYRPHVTLARSAPPPGAFEGEPFVWRAGAAVLAESRSAEPPHYRFVTS